MKSLTPDQIEILESVRDNRRTAALASHAIGKTFVAAIAANWWYDCWDQHIVYITAPNWQQALGLTFKQIKLFRYQRRLPGDILESGRVRDTDKSLEPGHFIKALNAESGEGFQGEHTSPILVILEEAVGVPPYIWAAADGLMTHPACRFLTICNPTDKATPMGDASESSLYNVLRISALDHPNIREELAGRPPLYEKAVRLLWLREMLEKEAEIAHTLEGDAFEYYSLPVIDRALEGVPVPDDAERWFYLPTADFQGRVLGIWPTQASSNVIPLGWLEVLPVLPDYDGIPEIGCDVARFGDDRTTICTRCGPRVWELKALRHMDNLAVTEALREACQTAATRAGCNPKDIPVRIDVTGGLGTGPFDILKSEGFNAIPVNAGETASDNEFFARRRSEMWFTTRERVRQKQLDLSLLPARVKKDLIRELSAPKYKLDLSGRKVVEPKEKTKELLGASPDLADALNLAFARTEKWWENKELLAWMAARGSTTPPPNSPPAPVEAQGFLSYMNSKTP